MNQNPKSVEEKVRYILLNHPETRTNDFVLYAHYILEFHPDLKNAGLLYALTHAAALGMPNYESITRARRKLQNMHHELRPTGETQERRAERERTFRSYAKEGRK